MQAEGEKVEQDFLLKVSNLSTHFRTERGIVKAVDNVSFTLKRGETIGIVGESGSGKSVTALSLMQLIPNPPGKIANGTIEFNHPQKGIIDLVTLDKQEMQQERGNSISMIFQEPMTSLNPVFTCGDQVMEAIQLHQNVSKQEAKKRTIELFQKVELPRPEAIFDSYPHQISGGQKQRVMIAMAMSCNPSVLIADEPTTALDVTVQARILELMQQLRDENNMGILFITHDLGVVAEIADKVIVMYQGKIVEQGTVYEIFSNPQHPYTKGLLACRPKLDLHLKVLPVVSDFMEIDVHGKFLEKERKFSSIGEAILFNYVSDEDIIDRNKALAVLEPQLKIKNLKTWFPIKKGFLNKTVDYVKAVDDVSFNVFPGETIGLVGESGCGKTTLGRSILRLIDPSEGSIEFEGVNILDLNEKELRNLRKDIQIIFQDPYSSLNPRMTIGEAIIEPMRINNILDTDFARKKRAIELLERVNLNRKQFNRYPHEFSGGQRQRICIARALALNPKFIICDESVSALDVSVQAQVLNLLNELKEEFNFTYIFISHDLSVVKFMSDRIIVMNKGKIEEMGYAEDIYHNPQTEYTKRLIHSIPKGNLEDILRAQLKRKNKV
ncbi:ABC transporter ATP-binding protein [Cytophaga hutchinsonii]|jgi:peptide/nickel transport system ATP-binding protein|uniref:ABC transporter, ATP-binding protein n=1 Tax=Cytophaga hutchinsonii (strain ATCC 33406 / DSM 1761 / CIP 103989 / NBRC 15051 / NCIMB 9469 / D465) TaxID=269798 RepID=A0A6N4SNA9_CYTH3|nr:ABC transporter ATP-binding protein [Cytophaga hutchinsonii]ABG57752.1 ABC transporter, ATP-binding protein [Cytophaga hutchinsonii ATCC 33406]SFX04607.1 peptide/nickel transport system ATP-binding protein [Cytophaga hutchinsonii ATCC 33406]